MRNSIEPSRFGAFVTIFLLGVLLSGAAFGQAVSQITGTIRDKSGAVVPGAEIKATQTETGVARTATADDSGLYILPNLPLGSYKVEASKMGFRTAVLDGIVLQVSSVSTIPITLDVGNLTESVEVQANATLVENDKLGVGTVLENQRVLELPLNGRNPTDLISLTPGAIQLPGAAGLSPSYSMNTGILISIAGGQSFGVYYGLDGAPHMNLLDATGMPLPFPDALQEFKVETSSQQAQAGLHAGAQVNAVTKSGTNAFHGDAFEFFRNGDLNARNFFSPGQDTLKRNQFGGVIGGPIKKNKLFFFAGFQGTTLRQTPAPSTAFVPTAAMLAGDFSVFASAACQGKNVTLGAPFTTINGKPNQLPQSAISSVALKISSYLPQPLNTCGRYLTSNLLSQYYWQLPVRVDYQLNDKQSIFFRYLGTKQNQVDPYKLTPNNVLSATGTGIDDLATTMGLGHTWLLSPTKVNSLRLSFNRVGQAHPGPQFFGPTDVGINAYSYMQHAMSLIVSGGFSINPLGDVFAHLTYLNASDDFNWIHGSHQFSFGGNITHSLISNLYQIRSIGNYTINGQTTGLGLGDFMTGNLSQMLESLPQQLRLHQWFLGFYAQDTWKATPRLTVNYGLRWEPFFPMNLNTKAGYTFSMDRYNAGIHSQVWTNAPAGFYYPGDPGYVGTLGIPISWGNFEPRVGLAWDPFGNGKTSIRAGAGTSYDFVNEIYDANSVLAAPFAVQTYVNGPIPIANPWGTLPGGNPFPGAEASKPPIGIFPVGSSYQPFPPEIKTTSTYSWNFLIQRQVTPELFASAGYVGSQTIHLWYAHELNPAIYIPGNCNAGQYGLTAPGPCSNTANTNNRRILYLQDPAKSQFIANLDPFSDGGTQSYHGLVLTTQWRAGRNLNVNGNYTWSHCIGIVSTGAGTPNVGRNPQHQFPFVNDLDLDRGNCIYDRRNLLNLTVVARTPNFSGRAVHLLASGWSLSTIYRYSSGAPISILSGLDNARSGFATNGGDTSPRANQVLQDPYATNKGSGCVNVAPCVSWLNPSAFAQPALGTLGNMGILNVLGPKYFQFDAALTRDFRVHEGQNLQFRAEAFNVFNNVRFNNPGQTLSVPNTFGSILGAQDPRILQLAMKFIF